MVWCCSKKMGEAEVYDPESGLHSSLGLCIDHDFNFILEAKYEQEVVPEKFKGRPLPEVLKYCEQRAQKRGAAGFFFQTHHNSHQIVGFYESVEAMQGRRVRHGHTRGFLAVPPPASELFTVDATANFVEGAEYEQEDIPASAKDRVLAATLHYCEQRAQKRGAAGYFYQQHTNGHEIVGFYTSAETMAAGKAGWHGHVRGFVATRRPAAVGALVLDGIAVKPV